MVFHYFLFDPVWNYPILPVTALQHFIRDYRIMNAQKAGAKNISQKYVYSFGQNGTDGDAGMKDLLGGKGANLAEMASLGLPVPPGFTLSTQVCTEFYKNDEDYPEGLKEKVDEALKAVEQELDMKFGDMENPLLLSVRSGARVSMPGMMDTVLNLGLNDITVDGLAKRSGDARFAYDSYRRFIQMYSDVVLDLDHYEFEDVLESYKRAEDITQDTDITADGWQDIIADYKDIVKRDLGRPFPQDVEDQLWGAIGAVFKSWMTRRAVAYRKINNISADWGTAVNIQAMVFGNMGQDCATGVAFTRDPSTGENIFYGEYLINAQGEDVVAGIRTPQHLTIAGKKANESDLPAMEETMPGVFKQLEDVRGKLEAHYKDVQDIEFTIQQGRLYMLQTRTGKRTAKAALKIAVDMVGEGLITKEDAIKRIDPEALDQLLHPTLDTKADKDVLCKGLPASPGAACGEVVFSADEAETKAAAGIKTILCRTETSPEDIHGMHAAAGILTTRGGMTSHAAVVARGMGRPCVAGAGSINIDYKSQSMDIKGRIINAGDIITLDGATGEIMNGEIATVEPELSGDFETVMQWADNIRRMTVRCNAETTTDAKTARHFGAEGIGLCRTEHMFFDPSRIMNVRKMILAETAEDRKNALAALEPEQKSDFKDLFEIMSGLPVTIRLLDPPLHEFLPHSEKDIAVLAEEIGISVKHLNNRIDELTETNPMLGHRGCRLAITFPEIYAMQVRAILGAAQECHIKPEIMIPLASTRKEIEILKKLVDDTAAEFNVEYTVGTMIELPRAALCADELAELAEFFSFGTNDLTQTTFGISRDDAGRFLPAYQEQGIIARDPFVSIDVDGVGSLVKTAVEKGRSARPHIKLGICGEHGGEPQSIAFFESVGLDYISCSPYRVPIARLAAAQAKLNG